MKSKIFSASTFILLSALTATGALTLREKGKWEITLKNRHFVPVPGIDTNLQQTLKKANIFPVHGIVQLFNLKTDHAVLKRHGVHLGQSAGGTAYFAEFSTNVLSATLTNKFIRWAGLILPEDKTQKSLWEDKIEDWARTPSGKIRVLAQFHSYVSDDDARKLLARYTPTFYRFNYNLDWAIEISSEKLKDLATEQSIRWLRPGPHAFRPAL